MDAVPADDSRSLLDVLEEALPIKREIKVDGWPEERSVWIWRLELSQILELNRKRKLLTEDERGVSEFGIELLVMCLGDRTAPGVFQSARGRSWLRRQPEAVSMLIPIAMEFNEINGPHPDRKKKSETATAPEPFSPSASELV